MNYRKILGYCLMAMFGSFADGCSASVPAQEALPVWYMAETADVIVTGKLHVVANPDALNDKFAERLSVTMEVAKTLKGSVLKPKITLHYQSIEDQDAPLERRLQALDGKDAIVYAYIFPERGYYIDLYFGEDRVVAATPDATNLVEKSLKENSSVAATDQYRVDGEIERKVLDAIDALVSESEATNRDGLNRLIGFSCSGVPVIIKHMRDSRPYHGDLALKPRDPNAIEGLMHYNAKTAYDALSHVLTYITGAYFSHSENFDSQMDRDLDYHGWQVYLAHLGSNDLKKSPFQCK